MKKTLLGLLVAMAAATTLLGNQVTVVGSPNGYGPYQTGQGGEFTLRPDAQLSWVLNAGYVEGVTKNVLDSAGNPISGTFQTFCVEHNIGENIFGWTTFDVTISQNSVFGNQPLTLGAAWLYHQFQIGQLEGYDYVNRSTAGALQDAIWYFMGMLADPGNAFSQLGDDHGGLTANNGTIPVAVLNLWVEGHAGEYDYRRQDVLICVPDGGLTAMLLGMGMLGLGWVRRMVK